MCKKCRGCGKSNLGAIVTHVETIAVRLIDGVVTEQFQDSYEEKETMAINYCFECAKEITEADLFEEVECPVCGKMVGGLTESGACQDCTDEANRLSNMSKEQLILMLMKQSRTSAQVSAPEAPITGQTVATHDGAVKANAPSEKKEEKQEEVKVDTQYIEDSLKARETAALEEANEIEAEMREATETVETTTETTQTTKKTTRTRKKAEPADVTETGVNEAKEEIVEKLSDVEVTDAVDPATVQDEENTAALTTINDAIPVANPNDDVDAILKELDGIDINDGEIF